MTTFIGRLFILALIILITACGRDSKTDHFQQPISFQNAKLSNLPASTSYAEKRGFADFNADGITDMAEVEDTATFGQKYTVKIFKGYFENGILHFSDKYEELDLPIKQKWFSSASKMDTGDVNGDGYADIIFTHYSSGYISDSLDIAFAMNKNGESFTFEKESVKFDLPLTDTILRLIEAYEGSEESLYDYLKMDWADMDGNGSDDLLLVWDSNNDMDIDIIFTQKGPSPTFTTLESAYLPAFLYDRSVRKIDTEDFNNDGLDDIIIFKANNGGKKINLGVAINIGQGVFQAHKDYSFQGTDMNVFDFEKFDSFDINNDGLADFIHIGTVNGKKSVSFNLNLK